MTRLNVSFMLVIFSQCIIDTNVSMKYPGKKFLRKKIACFLCNSRPGGFREVLVSVIKLFYYYFFFFVGKFLAGNFPVGNFPGGIFLVGKKPTFLLRVHRTGVLAVGALWCRGV